MTARGTPTIALRYALAVGCVAAAVLLHISLASPHLDPTGLFVLAVVAAAWFGGVGPGLFAALLATLALPQLVAMGYPPLADVFDLLRFITFGITGAAVGWGSARRRLAEAALRDTRAGLEAAVAERTAALRESEERYALAMEASEEGHFEWNVITDEMFASAHVKQLFGVSAEVEYRTRSELAARVRFYPGDWERLDEMTRLVLGGTAQHDEFEYRILRGDEVRWLRRRWKIFRDADGVAQRVIGVLSDVTDRKRFEEELRRSEQELRRAQRLESMGTLAGGIAHDFNNILGAILGYGEMALRGAKEGTRLRRDLDAIMSAGERGRALVDRVLAFSRSAVGERIPVHVEAVVREALDLLAGDLPEGIRVRTELRGGHAAMLGDPTQVHQVVMNLATNAVHAMPKGGVLRVSLERQHVEAARTMTVGALAPGRYLVLQVADSGSGIRADVFERMFDPFFTTKEVGVGSGLGLSLVHGIVTNVGGAIDVATELGKGTKFTVYLPHSGEAPGRTADEKRPLPRGAGQRVLVVDDEEPLVRLATETLEGLGYAPTGFTSSANALEAFGADPKGFDAVLTDERMPGVTGSNIIREVRRLNPSIPIVLMSGFVGAATALKARELGANDVLKKPLLARELATSLARVLRH